MIHENVQQTSEGFKFKTQYEVPPSRDSFNPIDRNDSEDKYTVVALIDEFENQYIININVLSYRINNDKSCGGPRV